MEAGEKQELVGNSWLLKWPLLAVLFPYLAGILLADRITLTLGIVFIAGFLAVVLAVLLRRWLAWILPLALLLAGWTNEATHTAIISPSDLRTIIGHEPEIVSVRGILNETPVDRIQERDEKQLHRVLAKVRVSEIRRSNQWQPAYGTIAVSTPGSLAADYYLGQTIEVTGVIALPQTGVAPGLFDYREYLRRQGIYFHLRTDGANDWSILQTAESPARPPLSVRFSRWAHHVLGIGLANDEAADLLRGMALGWRTALNNETSQPFMRSGTMHLFAISGLHIALIAGILVQLFRVLNVPRFYAGLFSIPLLWFYTAATGWQPSAIRSAIMMTIVVGSWMLHRPQNLLNSLGAAGFIILLWDPQQLFQAGFQLSFLVVLSIALLVPPFIEWRDRWLQPDPFLPEELIPQWQRHWHRCLKVFTTSVVTSFAAWLGSLPLIAHYFYLFTPISLLANVLVVPASTCALAANLASLVFGTWAAPVTEIFNNAAWLFMRWMMIGSEWSAEIPGGWLYVPSFTWSMYATYYALLILVITRKAQLPRWRIGTALLCVALAIPMLWRWHESRSTWRLTVLALNGGDAIHFDAPGRVNDLLIDCGNESAAETIVAPFIHSRGINSLPQLLLTHGDLRHVGGAPFVREELAIAKTITSSIRSRSPSYRRVVQDLTTAPEQWQQVHRGDAIGPWRVLHPLPDDKFSQGDDNALVLQGTLDSLRVLLVSDLGKLGQRTLLERESDLRADVLVTGIPTQGEPISDELLEAIQPRAIIVSASDFPVQERATKELRSRLAARGVPIYYTSDRGSVVLTIRKEAWHIETMR